MKTKRFLWADVIRIIAIYLVVQMHTAFVTPDDFIIPFSLGLSLFEQVSVICVPLFALLSGALLLGKKEKYAVFFKKRCFKVLVPWLVWTGIYMVQNFHSVRKDEIVVQFFSHSSTFISWIQYFTQVFLSQLWFLPLIFGLYLVTPLLRIFVQHAKSIDNNYYLILWFSCFSLLPFVYPSNLFPDWDANIVFAPIQYSGYFLLGYLLVHKHLFAQYPVKTFFIIALSPLFISFLPISHPYITDSLERFLNPGVVGMSVGFFLLLIALVNKFEKHISSNVKEYIHVISSATLGIYLVHQIIMEYIGIPMLSFLHIYRVDYLITFIVFGLSAVLVIGLQKIPLIKYIVP